MNKLKISACIVAYNAEGLIERCLDSLTGAVDEIVVVHDGPCRDNTLEICKRYTKKAYVQPYRGYPEAHRFFALSKATGDWILHIDQDEYLSEELRQNMHKLTEDKTVNAYRFIWEVTYGDKVLRKGSFGNVRRLCFFRKGYIKLKGVIHETPVAVGKIKDVNLLLHHRPFSNNYTFKSFKEKWLKWAYIEAKSRVDEGRANLPAVFYIPKAFVWLFAYFFIYMANGISNGYPGFKISLLQGLYNFFLDWDTFKIKAGIRARLIR